MKKYILFLFISAVIVLSKAAFCEYNANSDKDEIILINDDQEVSIGKKLSKDVEKAYELVEDEGVQERVDDIGQKVAKVCQRRYISFHFKVLKGDDVNAFSLPGGYVYIFEGILKNVKSDDELASVIAHEVGHIASRHNIKRLQGSLGANVLLILASLSPADSGVKGDSAQAITELMLEYSRENEMEADRLSVKYLKAAGYNPEGAATFLKTMKNIMAKAPLKPYRPYRTHPYLSERMAIIKEEIHGKMDFIDYINRP